MNAWWKALLLASVVGILILFALGLGNDPRSIPSPLVNKPAADFTAPSLFGGEPVSLAKQRGRWVLLNFWGSWCVSCIAEHPYLLKLAEMVREREDFVIIGVDFKDTQDGAMKFLKRHGNPGYAQAFDPSQKIAIDYGVYGAPESFLIDPHGTIRLKHTGPLYDGWFENVALPLITEEQVGGKK